MFKFDRNIKHLLLLLFLYFILVYFLFNMLGITCVFLEVFSLPCFGCGMTRAVLSLVEFDIVSAAKYNITVFFMPYVFAYVFFDFKGKVHNYVMVCIAFVAILNWIVKLTMYL